MRPKPRKMAAILADLAYGDSGKGTVTDYLSELHEPSKEVLVVRHNGGGQAAHRVVMPDGRSHVFSQFGSGMFRPGVRTLLSRHMLVSPLAMLEEERCLDRVGVRDAFDRTYVSEEALVVSPFHRAANRVREMARGAGRHGSCGLGIGETAADAIAHPFEALRIRDLKSPDLQKRLRRIQERKRAELMAEIKGCRHLLPGSAEEIACLEDPTMSGRWIDMIGRFLASSRIVSEDEAQATLLRHDHVIFEGAQGVLLDEWRGFHPYTTWSTCTFDNALDLLDECGWDGGVVRLGIIRAYATRHGAGPFPTENAEMSRLLPDSDNVAGEWQGDFRVGWLDMVAVRYAVAACGGIDALAVTCLDRLEPFRDWMVCDGYETSEGVMSDLPLGHRGDLDHQAVLTRLMMKARPKFRVTTDQAHSRHKIIEHALAIEHLLDEPITGLLISTGPTIDDKATIH